MMKHRSFFSDLVLVTTSRHIWKALIILILGIIITITATIYIKTDIENDEFDAFQMTCNDLKTKISLRLFTVAHLLRNGAVVFAASDTVTRSEWKEFFIRSKINNILPGLQGVGFSLIVPSAQLKNHIQTIRKEGFPEYSVNPSGDRDLYTSIIYIEPFEGRNLQAFGYDMFSESVRKKAMETARDSDMVTLTDKVVLVQATGSDSQAGTVMYVPVYRNKMPINTVGERRAAIEGWVYSSFRMNDLISGIIEYLNDRAPNNTGFKVFDGTTGSANALLYDSRPDDSQNDDVTPDRSLELLIDFNNTKWLLYFTQYGRNNSVLQNTALLVFIGGLIISFLLFFFLISIFNTGYRAREIAKQLTSELKESESRFKSMFERHRSIMLLIEPVTGRIIDANISASEFYNFSIAELCTMSIDQINLAPADPFASDRLQAAGREQNYFIYRHKLANGEPRDIEVHSSPVAFEGKTILFYIIHDITERKRSQDALNESERRYRTLFETSPAGIMVLDEKGIILEANEAISKLTLYSIDELIGADVRMLSSAEQVPVVDENIRKILHGHVLEGEFLSKRKDGTISTVILRETAIVLPNGKHGILTVSNDITDRKKAEEDLKNLNATLEDRIAERTSQLEAINKELEFQNKEIEQFTYIASHDLQEPLRTLTNYSQLVNEEYAEKLDDDGKKYIEFIYGSAARMRDLVKGLLDYSLLGKERVIRETDCNQIVAEVLSDMDDLVRESDAKIYVNDLPPIHGYTTELRLLFQNLISNALKFKSRTVVPEITISALKKEKEWIFAIADNGIGIEEKDKEKVFIIFKRMHNRNQYAGTGIGLAHCKKIVEMHGGRIWVESVPGEGSTFKFSIPTWSMQ